VARARIAGAFARLLFGRTRPESVQRSSALVYAPLGVRWCGVQGGGLGFAITGVLVGTASPTPAAPTDDREPRIELRWSAPPSCPDAERIHDQVARFLADGADRAGMTVTIDARVRADGDRFALELSVDSSAGAIDKSMTADDCQTLASAVALLVAVLLDPTAVVETVEREREPAVAPTPPPAREPPPPTAEPKRRRFEVQGLVRPFVLGSFGPLPRFGVAAGGLVGVRIGRARVEVHALYDVPQRSSADGVDAGARFDLWAVGPRGCFAPRWRTLEVPICGGGEVGRIRAQGYGLSVRRSPSATWAALTAGAALLWVPLRWLAVGGGADAVVALARPSFVIDDLGRIHRPRPAGVRIHAGLELRFP